MPVPPLRPHHTAQPSATAMHLGRAGLLPFVACTSAVLLGPATWQATAAAALAAYAAVIVSFLGGIHWGLVMRHMPQDSNKLLVWGVVPSLLAWPALLLPHTPALALLGASLLLCYAVDRRWYPLHGGAAWLALRAQLTTVATLCCWAAAAGLWWR